MHTKWFNRFGAALYQARFPQRALVMSLALGALAGCEVSPNGPATVKVRGTVTYEGKAIEGANVIFHPAKTGGQTLASQAVTDTSGRFQLSTHVGGGKFKPGIVPGQYAVVITKPDIAGISTTLGPPKNLLPKKYSHPNTSGLTAEVAAGRENDYDFALTAD
jgi:hypothetical protein